MTRDASSHQKQRNSSNTKGFSMAVWDTVRIWLVLGASRDAMVS